MPGDDDRSGAPRGNRFERSRLLARAEARAHDVPDPYCADDDKQEHDQRECLEHRSHESLTPSLLEFYTLRRSDEPLLECGGWLSVNFHVSAHLAISNGRGALGDDLPERGRGLAAQRLAQVTTQTG